MNWMFWKAQELDSSWEGHPCELPPHVGITHEGLTWQCFCGRRWTYYGSEIIPTGKIIRKWREECSTEVAEGIDRIENYANGE
jgi:hypothetical protein